MDMVRIDDRAALEYGISQTIGSEGVSIKRLPVDLIDDAALTHSLERSDSMTETFYDDGPGHGSNDAPDVGTDTPDVFPGIIDRAGWKEKSVGLTAVVAVAVGAVATVNYFAQRIFGRHD
jgi:hypothetical protein